MKKKKFTIDIKAPKEKVWDVLWGDRSYGQWTSVFSEGSHAETDWKEGSKVLFLSADKSGMNSLIAKRKDNEFMSFKHLGVIKEGKEVPPDEKSKEWAGATENYTLAEKAGGTLLTVDMDITEDFESYFDEKFPEALEKVKVLSEN
jgi:hypothetical protein